MADELGVYVYGTIPSGSVNQIPALPGVDPSYGLDVICQGRVAAVVSSVSLAEFDEEPLREHLTDLQWLEHVARAHERVLDGLLDLCTPVPMRLCSVYRDEQGLRTMLSREHDLLAAALDELAGHLEWGVKAFALPRPGGISDAFSGPASEESKGRSYLAGRLAARRSSEQALLEQEQACDRLHALMSEGATAAGLGPLQRREVSGRETPMILNAFYLVERDRAQEFQRQLATVGAELEESGVEVELTGPWPPYNFVPPQIGGAL